MKIPVFVSGPSHLNPQQNAARDLVIDELDRLQLEPRAIGRSDYPTDLPLREVMILAKHCSGGIILGFEQVWVDSGVGRRGAGDDYETELVGVAYPTPWNQLEAGILFALGLPVLVFREESISGGVFDEGVTDVFVHRLPDPKLSETNRDALSAVMLKWQAKVRSYYYAE